jgi:ATP-dependent nuclease subunit A
MNWTAEQARAIELREKNILVAAAAGSGKTAVLVERIKKLILEGECSIDRMLIVTFTNAAAAEMKEKIERAIEKEAEENPGQVRLLKQQLERLPLANISTFHAFALEVIRRFFYLINVDPNFKICDNVQQELLKEQALDELLKEYFDAESPEFFAFLNKYSGDRNELKFRQTVRKTFEVIQSLPEPFPWLSAAARNLDSDFETFASGKIPQFIMEDAFLRFEEALGSILRFAEEAERLAHEGAAEITAAYVNIASELRDAARSGDFEALRALLSSVKMPSLLKKYFKPDDSHPQAELEEFKEKLEAARVPLKDAVTSLKKDFFYDSLASLHAEIRETFPDAAFFLKVMEDYRDIFAGLKKERGVVDFSDIEHFAFEILKDEEAASYYREKFAYIFIDEYQDSNLLQEALIARIKRENNLFMVGDVKQSIYKFRLAEPEIFQARYRDFADEQNRAEAEGVQAVSEKIDLNKNFRSKESVIRFINRVFDAAMPGYDENAALHLGDPFGHNCNFEPKLFLAETPWDEDSELDDELKTMIKAEKEALAAARIIKDSLGKTIFDSKRGIERPLEKGDIVILLRGIKNYGDIFYKTLSDNNLPAYVDDNDGYFDTMEINMFLSLLEIIDNEKQDIPLITVMRSEIWHFSVNELAGIRAACTERCSYHDAVLRYAEDGPDTVLRQKCRDALSDLAAWRQEARLIPLEELVWKLMLDTGFYIAMGAMPSGSRRQANLRALCDKALAYRKAQGGSLYSFVQYIDAVKQHKVAMGQVKMAAEGDDTIRIMTIHKSKGLEFPMVLLAGFCRRLNYTRPGSEIAVHKDIGIGFPLVNYEESWMKTTLIQNIIRVKLHREEVEEEKRILYVAMTRAKDILYILGMVDDFNEAVSALVKAAPSDSSYFSMCGRRIYEAPEARGYISNEALRALSEGTRRSAAQALALLEIGMESPIDDVRLSKDVERRMTFEYPFAADLKIKSKYAVSEIAARDEADISLSEPKSFKAHDKFTLAQIGTITHKVLEKIDFNSAFAGTDTHAKPAAEDMQEYVATLIESMVRDEFLSKEEAETVNPKMIGRFIVSPLGLRMAAAAKAAAARAAAPQSIRSQSAEVPPAASKSTAAAKEKSGSSDFLGLQRERPFNLVLEQAGAQSIVQGIIDCFFEEGGELVLVDYKTTGVGSEGEFAARRESIRARYAMQIDLYRRALEAATGKHVKEAYLYLTNLGETIEM